MTIRLTFNFVHRFRTSRNEASVEFLAARLADCSSRRKRYRSAQKLRARCARARIGPLSLLGFWIGWPRAGPHRHIAGTDQSVTLPPSVTTIFPELLHAPIRRARLYNIAHFGEWLSLPISSTQATASPRTRPLQPLAAGNVGDNKKGLTRKLGRPRKALPAAPGERADQPPGGNPSAGAKDSMADIYGFFQEQKPAGELEWRDARRPCPKNRVPPVAQKIQ
jgi:hypothetical protein